MKPLLVLFTMAFFVHAAEASVAPEAVREATKDALDYLKSGKQKKFQKLLSKKGFAAHASSEQFQSLRAEFIPIKDVLIGQAEATSKVFYTSERHSRIVQYFKLELLTKNVSSAHRYSHFKDVTLFCEWPHYRSSPSPVYIHNRAIDPRRESPDHCWIALIE